MTNKELKQALIEEAALPHEILKDKHPSIDDHKPEFVDYTEDGRFTMKYTIKHAHCNGYHLLQGGLLTAYFDDNFGLFVYVAGEQSPFSTINMTVNFHKAAVEADQYIYVTTWVTSSGKRIVSMAGEARTAEGKLLATSQCNMMNGGGIKLSL